jgi:uncharacterized repeat protein (TIGR01451 family)
LEVGGNEMETHRTSTSGRSRRRALTTVFCSMLVFAVAFGQAALPASADAPTLTMGQVNTGSSGQGTLVADTSLNVDLDQFANKPGKGWVNGDLNGNNSAYAEGDVVPFRLAIEGLSAGAHTIHLNYDFTAGGHEAYDFLATWNDTENPSLCASGGGAVSSMCPGLPAPNTQNFKSDPFAPGSPTKAGKTVAGAEAFAGIARQLTLYGGTITNLTVPSHSGPVGGNSTADITVSFTTSGSAALFAWGAHIAQSQYWVTTNNDPNGAAMVSGAPWHMRTQQLDGAGNKNQDRSIQPSAIVSQPNVSVVKTADDATISAGEDAGFTITVTNDGPGTASNVTLHDPLPAGVAWAESPDNPDCTIASGTLDCSFGDLIEGASASVHIVGPTEAADCGTLTNTATVKADNEDPNFGSDNSSTATITVQCPSLHITKVADDATVSAGDTIGYTITVSNSGPGTAFDVVLHDTLPTNAGLSWSIESTTGGWNCGIAAGVLTCGGSGFDLAAGADASVHITSPTTSATCGTVSNTATADASNTSEISTGIVTITVQCASLEITKVADDAVVNAGETIGYTITVTNNGAGTAKNVVVTDTLPTNAGLDWSIDGGTGAGDCSITAGVLTCTFGDMGPGDSFTVHLSSPTTAATCGQVVNAASASTSNDGNPSTGNVTITVNCPDISVVKTADDGTVDAADQVGFLITVANAGPGVATDVHLDDPLPTNAGLDWSIDGGTGAQFCDIVQGSLVCDFGDMDGGTSYTVHITSDTDATTCGQIDNTATVTIGNGDGDSDGDSITVNCPDLGIDLVKDGETLVHVGDTVHYDFTVTLTTSEPLFDVTLTDDTGVCDADPVFTGGDDGDGILEPAEVWTYTCEHVVTEDDPFVTTAGDGSNVIFNTATVEGTADDGRSTQATDDHTVTVINPGIDIVKTVNPLSGQPGDTVTYTYTVTNTGDTTLYNVSVDDDVLGHIGDIAVLEPGDANAVTLTKDWVLPNDVDFVVNVGTATGTDVLGKTVTADDDANVTIVQAAHNPPKPPPPTAFTGSDALRFALVTLVLLGLGLLTMLASRRRRHDAA